jgi:glycosyltransferase involved in cell wall biosynthesis
MLVTVAMPAYDEVDNLERTVRDALDAITATREDGEVLVVDDGSTDGTGPLADRLARSDARVRVAHHRANRGFSGAMTTALRQSRGEWVFLVPADGQVRMSDLPRFLAERTAADVVVGIRAHRPDSARRALLSQAFHKIAKLLFPIPLAEFSAAFLFRRALVDAMPIRSRPGGASFLPEVLYRATVRRARFAQLVIETRPRVAGRAKGARLDVAVRTLLELVRLAPLVRWDEFRDARRARAGEPATIR